MGRKPCVGTSLALDHRLLCLWGVAFAGSREVVVLRSWRSLGIVSADVRSAKSLCLSVDAGRRTGREATPEQIRAQPHMPRDAIWRNGC